MVLGMMDDEDDKMSSRNYPRNVEDDDHDNDKDNMDDGVQRIGKDEDDDDSGDLHSKKRKFQSVLSSASKSSYGGGTPPNAHVGWTEDETLILLNAWGELSLKKRGKNISYDEWKEVAEKVSQESKIERTDSQCRNRMDTLKKQYKKEKMKFKDDGNSGSEWIYFEKMEALLSSGVLDSREHVFRNTKSPMKQSNEGNAMRDSPAHSEAELEGGSRGPLHLVADSVKKLTEIFEKVESGIRRNMVELEEMRTEFYRDLEFQRREIWERAQADIEKIRQEHDDDDDEKNSG